MSDGLSISTELKGIRASVDGLKALKKGLDEAKESANALGNDAEEAMQKIREKSSDTLEVLDRLGTAAFLDDFSDRVKYAGEAFMVAEDKSRSFAVRTSAAISGVSGIVGMFAQNIFAASQALAAGAASAEQNERAIRTLGAAWGEVQRQTADTVTAQQALTMQQAFLRNGMSTTADEMGTLARAAREFALTTGTDTSSAMGQLTQALQSGDREGLRPFNISVREGTTRSEAYRQALHQLRDQQHGSAVEARTFAEENERVSRAWTEMQNTLFGDIARWIDLRSNIVGVTQALTSLREEGGLSGHADMHRTSTAQMTRGLERRDRVGRLMMATAQRLGYRAQLVNPNQLTDQQLDFLERTLGDPLGDTEDMRAGLEFATATGTNMEASRAATARARVADAQRAQRERDAQLRAQDRRDRNAAMTPEERRRRWLEEAARNMDRDIRNKRSRLQGQLTNEYAANTGSFYTDDFNLDIDTSLEAQNSMRSQVEDKQRSQFAYEAELERERMRAEEERASANAVDRKAAESDRMTSDWRFGRSRDLGLQIGNQFGGSRTMQEHLAAPVQSAAESVKGSFDLMTNGLTSFMDTLIESPDKIGEASVQIAKQFLKGLAMMAVQKALFSTAEGITALITAPAAAPGYFTAAGIYAAVALASGAGAAGVAAGQRGATQSAPPMTASGPSSVASVSGSGARGHGGGDSYTIIVQGSVLDQGGLEDAVGRAVRGNRSRGN